MSYFKKPHLASTPVYFASGDHDCPSDLLKQVEESEFSWVWKHGKDYDDIKIPLKDDPSKHMVILVLNG